MNILILCYSRKVGIKKLIACHVIALENFLGTVNVTTVSYDSAAGYAGFVSSNELSRIYLQLFSNNLWLSSFQNTNLNKHLHNMNIVDSLIGYACKYDDELVEFL